MHTEHQSTWMRVSARTWALLALSSLIALLCVSFFFRAYTVQVNVMYEKQSRIQNALNFSLWRYGMVESVDISNESLIVSIRENFPGEALYRKIRVHVNASTRIGEQHLIGETGTYTALSPIQTARLADIQSGMRVALVLDNRVDEGRIVADVLLFGNPL